MPTLAQNEALSKQKVPKQIHNTGIYSREIPPAIITAVTREENAPLPEKHFHIPLQDITDAEKEKTDDPVHTG